MDTLKKSPGYVIVCFLLLTVMQLSLGGNKLCAQSQTTVSDSIDSPETKIKQKQAEQLSTLCPHYPTVVEGAGGMSLLFDTAYKQWIIDYPNEYAEYKKIFNYK